MYVLYGNAIVLSVTIKCNNHKTHGSIWSVKDPTIVTTELRFSKDFMSSQHNVYIEFFYWLVTLLQSAPEEVDNLVLKYFKVSGVIKIN